MPQSYTRTLYRQTYRRIPVGHVSLDTLQRDYDYEPASNDFEAVFAESTDLYQALTKRQRKIARDLAKGKTRKEVAAKHGISVQAIHQMVPRMRKRLRAYMENRCAA